MQATLDYKRLHIQQEKPNKVTIPNNDIARLMYYLNCVFYVIQYDIDKKFTDYNNYYNLTKKEEETVVGLALLFNPKILIDLKIFILDSRLLIGEFSNEFYKITDERIGIHVNEEVMIGGKVVRVLKVMAINENWLNNNYLDPIDNINNRKKNNYLPSSSSNYNYNYNYYSNHENEGRCKKKCKKCCCCIIIFIVIFIILCFLYNFFEVKNIINNYF